MYVLKNIETGKYVARSGSQSSYTTKLELARKYPTKEAAVGDACGNERAINVEDLLR